jgi:AraC-like DNA-binding protein
MDDPFAGDQQLPPAEWQRRIVDVEAFSMDGPAPSDEVRRALQVFRIDRRCHGTARYLRTPIVEIRERSFSTDFVQEWMTGENWLLLAGPIRLDDNARFLGRSVKDVSLLVMPPGHEGSFRSAGCGANWSIGVAIDRLETELRERYGTSLDLTLTRRCHFYRTQIGLGGLSQRVLDGSMQHLPLHEVEAQVVRAVARYLAPPCRPLTGRAAYRLARRARDQLIDTQDAPLRLPELASSLGVGQRTLYAAFVEVYGLPPMAFRRAVQLDRVRHRLAAQPQRASVTEVAFDEGFTHLGRFAGAYHRRFGELPSDTLRRARNEAVVL